MTRIETHELKRIMEGFEPAVEEFTEELLFPEKDERDTILFDVIIES